MNIKVMNRDDVESGGIVLANDYLLISVSCPNDKAALGKIRDNCKAVLRLEFDDVDVPVHLLGGRQVKLFSRQDAKDILSFLNDNKGPEYLIIHCDAGISRSPAIAAAITKINSGWDHEYFKRYLPNRRVYSILLAEHYNSLT